MSLVNPRQRSCQLHLTLFSMRCLSTSMRRLQNSEHVVLAVFQTNLVILRAVLTICLLYLQQCSCFCEQDTRKFGKTTSIFLVVSPTAKTAIRWCGRNVNTARKAVGGRNFNGTHCSSKSTWSPSYVLHCNFWAVTVPMLALASLCAQPQENVWTSGLLQTWVAATSYKVQDVFTA